MYDDPHETSMTSVTSHGAKLALLAGTLGVTALAAYWLRRPSTKTASGVRAPGLDTSVLDVTASAPTESPDYQQGFIEGRMAGKNASHHTPAPPPLVNASLWRQGWTAGFRVGAV